MPDMGGGQFFEVDGAKRPYLLIDVDGVLNPFGAVDRPRGFAWHELGGYGVWLSRRHGEWLNGLAEWFDLVWATTWEHDADLLIAPVYKKGSSGISVRHGLWSFTTSFQTSARARQKGPPLPPPPSHQPQESRGEGRCDGEGGRGSRRPLS